MKMPSLFGWLQRFWVVAVVVLTLMAAVAVVSRLRTFFDSDLPFVAGSERVDAIVPFNTKRVTYEVVGPPATSGQVSFLDANGKTREATFTALPWSVDVVTTAPGILANVVAQGDSTSLGCRILVNDKVVAERHAAGRDAQAFCLDKAA
ncbi:MmpS family transport accessory protein [Mycolicibacterium brisbanense]|uniref:Membrane family protein n=1 Tax=Mycolicibacterium brisbanense TaxID=146020 RepID=A0A117I455_9MYCO|nr:MmpS family transport accessory protein [Mycolicibacterium brisbanense]MCV7156233.1 transport acessory protein MmpS [Mycolicibacterium brisbanense]GAS86374.1 membrane family protein, precursor [Mycolicibacterium brisbanense]